MNAPPGVDSDSSDEDISPISSPAASPIKPKFSFKSLFIPNKSNVEPVSGTADSSPVCPAEHDEDKEEKGDRGHLAKLKRRVRILAGGDQKPTTNKGDEVEDTQNDDEPELVEEEKDPASVEMLTVLTQLVAQSRLDIPNAAKISTSDPLTPILPDPPKQDAVAAPTPDTASDPPRPPKKARPPLLTKLKPTLKPQPQQDSNATTSPTQNMLEQPETGSPGLNDTYFHPEHYRSGCERPQDQQQLLNASNAFRTDAAPPNHSDSRQASQPYSAPPWQNWHTPQNHPNQSPYHASAPYNYPPPMYPHPQALQPWHPSHSYGPPPPPSAPPSHRFYTQDNTPYNSYSPFAPTGPGPPWSSTQQLSYAPPQPSFPQYAVAHPYQPPQPSQSSWYDPPSDRNPESRPPWSPLGQLANPWSPVNASHLQSEGLRLRPVNQKHPEWATGPEVMSMEGSIRRQVGGHEDLGSRGTDEREMGSVREDPVDKMGQSGVMGAGQIQRAPEQEGKTRRSAELDRSPDSSSKGRVRERDRKVNPEQPDEGVKCTRVARKAEDGIVESTTESSLNNSEEQRSQGSRSGHPDQMAPRTARTKATLEETVRSKDKTSMGISDEERRAAKLEQAKRATIQKANQVQKEPTTRSANSSGREARNEEEDQRPEEPKPSRSSSERSKAAEREKAQRLAMLKEAKAERAGIGGSKSSGVKGDTVKTGDNRIQEIIPERSPQQAAAGDRDEAKRAAMKAAKMRNGHYEGSTSAEQVLSKKGQRDPRIPHPSDRAAAPPENFRGKERTKSKTAEAIDEPFAGMLTSTSSQSAGTSSKVARETRPETTTHSSKRRVTEPNWTKALISLAICIDLGYSQFQRHKRNQDARAGSDDITLKLVVGLAKTLSGGKDIPSAFEAVFDDRKSGEVFAKELQNVATFTAHSSFFDHHEMNGKSDEKRGKSRYLIDLLLSNDKVNDMFQGLPIGKYVTPAIVGIVKDLAAKWMKDELSLKIVLRSVLAIRKELEHPTKPQAHPQQQGLLDYLAIVLSKQLKHQSAAIPAPAPPRPPKVNRPSRTESTTPKSAPPQLRPAQRTCANPPVEQESSDSMYSEPESPGTRESDEEADRMLAVADSGPRLEPVREYRAKKERPGKEQVKAAKEVLMQ